MTREEYTELCQTYLEPLNCANIKTTLIKGTIETGVYCGGVGVTKGKNISMKTYVRNLFIKKLKCLL